MKDALRIALFTLVIFGSGLGVGIWTQRLQPMGPPPLPPLGEFQSFPGPGGPPMKFKISREKAAELEAATEKLRPQIQAFEESLAKIETDFRARFEAILSPEQKATFTKNAPPPFVPPADSRRPDHMMGPLGGIAFFTIITPAQDFLSRDLALTADQQAKLRELLVARRQEFLNLIDRTPPPSLELGRMAAPPPLRPEK